MGDSFKQFIDSAESVLILLPSRPYFDQVAAGLSLFLALDGKKSVNISSPSPMVVEFNRLVGVDRISKDLGNQNLVIKFSSYPTQNIERVTYDIENEEFKLSVIPKPNMTAPRKDQIELSYSGMSSGVVVLVGGANDSHFPELNSDELVSAKVAHVGTHTFSSNSKRSIISFAKFKSSTSEVMAGFIKELNGEFAKDIASNLLSGMHEGSKNFSHSQVDSNTFKLASVLMESGGSYSVRDERANLKKPTTPFKQEFSSKTDLLASETEEKEKSEEAPKSWLEPKIYKGSSTN